MSKRLNFHCAKSHNQTSKYTCYLVVPNLLLSTPHLKQTREKPSISIHIQTPASIHIQTPASSASNYIQTPACSASNHIRTPASSTSNHIQTPANSASNHIQTPANSASNHIQTPASSASNHIQTPASSASNHIQTPASSARVRFIESALPNRDLTAIKVIKPLCKTAKRNKIMFSPLNHI